MNKETLAQLEEQYGNAFFILDEDQFTSNLNEAKSKFEAVYNNFAIAYSFKTNYIPRMCSIVLQQDQIAEVVSEMEYDLAIKVGFPPEKIIFNGPIKTPRVLKKAFDNGSIVHFDCDAEIDYLELYLKENTEKVVKCAARVNFALEGEEVSRFGFDAEDGTAKKVYKRLFKIERCEPIGVHCHYQTSTKTLESYTERTQNVADFAKDTFGDKKIEYLDIGGGYYGNMPPELKAQFTQKIPSYQDYAETIGSVMKSEFPDETVQIIIEPGTMVAADTVKYYCTVEHIKQIQGKDFVIANGSLHNIKPTGRSRILPSLTTYSMNRNEAIQVKNADIVGYTCIEGDTIAYDVNKPLAVGDYLEFSNVGAYSLMYKPPFIKGQPPILGQKGNQFELVKRNETLDDIFTTYVFD